MSETTVSAEQRLKNIRGHIGQSLVREIDTVTLSTQDALWLHSQGLHLLDAKELIQQDMKAETAAARDVLAERRRQVEAEGWAPEHDDQHRNGQLAGAAACYALTHVEHWAAKQAADSLWPWDDEWWKPSDQRRSLVKAGALILAEIERLDRAGSQP